MISSLLTLVLFSTLVHTLIIRSTEIPLSLYTDESCLTPSSSAPNITLGLNVCTVTTGLESFILPVTPCISGNVKAWGFTDTTCTNVGGGIWSIGPKQCYASSTKGAIAAIMLTCDANAYEVQPSAATATMTVSVGPVANAYPTSTPTSSSSPAHTSTPNSRSPWDNLKIGSRVGIILGGTIVAILFLSCFVRGFRSTPVQVRERRFEEVTVPVRVLREV